MKEKINIYYKTFEPFNFFNKIFTIQFFSTMNVIVLQAGSLSINSSVTIFIFSRKLCHNWMCKCAGPRSPTWSG